MARNTITQRIVLAGGEEVRKQLKDIGEAGQTAFKKLGDAQSTVARPAQQLAAGMRQVEISIRGVAVESQKATSSLSGLRARLAVVAAGALAAGVAIAKFAKNSIDTADALGLQAKALGLSASQLDRYQKAAAIAGVESSKFVNGLKKISDDLGQAVGVAERNLAGFVEVTPGRFVAAADTISAASLKIGDAFQYVDKGVQRSIIVTNENIDRIRSLQGAYGNLSAKVGEAGTAYAQYGVSLVDTSGKAKSLADVLDDISKVIQATPDRLKKVKIAEAFGLVELLPLLDDSKQGMGELLAIVDKFALSPELQNKLSVDAREFNKQLAIIKAQMQYGAQSLTVSFAQLFQGPLDSILASLKSGTGDAANDVKKSLLTLTALFGGLQGRFNSALATAFKEPLTGLLQFLSDNAGSIDGILTTISQTLATFATDVGRVFAANFADGKFQFIRASDAEVQNKWLITLRDSAVAVGTAIAGAFKNYIKPAFEQMQELTKRAVAALNEIFGTKINAGEIGVVAVLLKVTGLLSPIIGLAKLASAALAGVLAPAVLLYATLSGDFEGTIKSLIKSVRELFTTGRDEAATYVKEIKGFFGEITKLFGEGANAPATPQAPSNPYSRSVPSKDELNDQVKGAGEVSKAWARAREEINGLFKNLKTALATLEPIGTKLLAAFNWLLGTEFSGAQIGILLVLAQLTGVLGTVLGLARTVAVVAGSLSFALLNVIRITAAFGPAISLVVGGIAALGRGVAALALAVVAGGGKGVLGAFTKLGTFIAGTFTRSTLAGLGRILVVLTRFAGLPGIIIGALSAVYLYWDKIKAGGEYVINYIKSAWNNLWGDTQAAQDGIKKISAEHSKYFRKMPEEQKSYWTDFVNTIRNAFQNVTGYITEALSPKEQSQSTWKSWLAGWLASILNTADKAKQALFGPKDEKSQEGFWDRIKESAASAWDKVKDGWQSTVDYFSNLELPSFSELKDKLLAPFQEAYDGIKSFFQNGLPGVAESARSVIEGVMNSALSTVLSVVSQIEAAVARAIARINELKAAAASAPSGGGGGFATGGYVSGGGTGTSDSIPAWLSNGEFVLRAAAVRKYGLNLLYALNGLKMDPRKLKGFPGYAMGGLVSYANRSVVSPNLQPALVAPTMPGKTFDLIIDGQRFGNVMAGDDVAGELMRYAAGAKMRSGGRKPGWYR